MPSFIGKWLNLVEHYIWDVGVAGSNPVFPTIFKNKEEAMKNIIKEFQYRRLAAWHKFSKHKLRYWLYDKLADYYEKKHLKEFTKK